MRAFEPSTDRPFRFARSLLMNVSSLYHQLLFACIIKHFDLNFFGLQLANATGLI